MDAIIPAIVGGIVSGGATWFFTNAKLHQEVARLQGQLKNYRGQISSLSNSSSSLQQEVDRLKKFQSKYTDVRRNLERSSVVREYDQPVILLGPRYVGKTSLLMQWHAPWNHSRLKPTRTHKSSVVPIYDFKMSKAEPHFADPDILTDVHAHLRLKVHDFPGEPGAQQSIIELATEETVSLRKDTGKSLGVVLICMFNAEEAALDLSQSTIDYYNGELFSNLRGLVAHHRIGIERIILVFNKYDLLRLRDRTGKDVALLKRCLEVFRPLISLLRGACNPERVCEVFTILSREDMAENNRGAPIVMGEAARNFVGAMAGAQQVNEVVGEAATNYSAPIFA